MTKGFLSIILHAHLPFVRHPEYERFLEETWLFEAITECYLPLLGVLDRLSQDQVPYRLTLSISPTLISLLSDPLLQERYLAHLQRQQQLATREITRTRKQPELNALARLYRRFFEQSRETYLNRYQGNLLAAFKKYYSAGRLELITTTATHAFLPLLNVSEAAVRHQIALGVETFAAHFGHRPLGFWLPECGYYPGLEQHLAAAGLHYFVLEAHGLLHASQPPPMGVYAPMACGNDVAAFARDPLSAEQVWSATIGYPGDADYREYYSDIGFELDEATLSPYLLEGKLRLNTGIKYRRITGGQRPKATYQPRVAQAKVQQHAQDFILKRLAHLQALQGQYPQPPIIVAPYDAELFGHWWFEGTCWLEQILRLASTADHGLRLSSCGDYLKQFTPIHAATPAASSWGENGYSSHWLNETNDWIYPLLHKAQAELEKLAADLRHLTLTPLQTRAVNQAFRSLLLAQASDWPFILKAKTTVEYAEKNLLDHLARFNYLHDSIRKNNLNERYLTALEMMDNIFPTLDFRNYFK